MSSQVSAGNSRFTVYSTRGIAGTVRDHTCIGTVQFVATLWLTVHRHSLRHLSEPFRRAHVEPQSPVVLSGDLLVPGRLAQQGREGEPARPGALRFRLHSLPQVFQGLRVWGHRVEQGEGYP